ncbi:MAG: hypothetical protein OEZ43_15465 [Gammaproteobacteria bacterium]|nr:hypothetical protein [Gammaproteobacteria bacterium]
MTELSIADQFINDVQLAKWGDQNRGIPPFNWKDVPILKDPFSLAVYPLLLWELKPATVIELGAYLGGSALWMADMMDTMNIKSHVYSYEIKRDLIKVEHPNITFIQMDLSKPENFDHEMLKSLPHPWLVIEDAHVNIYNTLSVFDKYVNAGDYVIVEDTLFPDTSKVEQFYAFLSEFGSGYEVDSHYTDMYGYNATWNLNGYLRKK